ncbi:PAS domain S-box protein [Haloarcula onubensis]|uniref:histidine kinase n=1 Tax=Haloarcula onubensis TaxID=2950539 RepID=A0ABU2FRZ3_9EURY|nr:PAS domain S-box protein [Halomicroarcula sp. S3CR25-11]MDS0283525.1 PAS domain S-box protein [Halomicroarcula sp. S3CR25-11]
MSSEGDIRVLHVDDEREFAEVAAMHLERADDGLDVVTEVSARDGLSRLRTSAVDCVVSDHDMPEMNGLEFLKAVREEFEELPFILFTGKGNEEIASDAISAGVTEYLQKDVGTDQYTVLANRIRRAVGETRAKSALEESERQLSTLISNLPGMVYRARNEADWPMEFVSDGAADLVGYEPEAIESGEVMWGTLIDDEDAERINPLVEASISADEPFEVSYRVTTADGERRWLWERGRVVGREDGVEILEGFITDITARIEREQELEREREFTENLVDTLDDVFYLVNLDGELLRWNDTATAVLGYSDEALSTMTAFDLIPEAFHDEVSETIERTVQTGQATFEAPLVDADGERIRHEFRGSLIEDGAGELLGVAGIARDITDQRQRERELEQYRTLVENVGDPMYVLDTEGRIQMANDAMVDHLDYGREDIVGADPEKFMPPDDIERATAVLSDLLGSPERTWETVEMRTVDVEGTLTVVENKVAPLVDADGEFVGSVGVMRDVTDRKQRDRELGRYETIVEAVGDPVYALDEDGVFTFVNEAIEPMTGYAPDELVGEHIGVIMTDEDVQRGDRLIQDLLADPDTDSGTLEMDVVTKWDERIPSENNLALLPTDDDFAGTAGVIRDIHERKAREERLAEFASVVSHDLRNPLNVVQGRLSLALETDDVSHLDAAAGAADRMEQLIEDLLTLARQGDSVGSVEGIDVATAAERAWANVDTVGATLELVDTATVDADPDRLRELLENLFRNSVEHGGYHHGATYDAISRRPPDDSALTDLTVTVGTMPAESDAMTGFYVADDGPGIAPEDYEKVFERGYTTAKGGTGFGLAIVEDIATAHGWSVRVTESESGGARFEFTTSRADH